MSWNSNATNDWSTATLNTYLNGDYYNGLDATSKSMIVNTKYYLGGNNSLANGSEIYYSWERGTTVYNGRSISWLGKIALMYPSDYSYTYALGVDNTCYTEGNNCSTNQGGKPTNGWVYNTNSNSTQWLLSPISDFSNRVFTISVRGFTGSSGNGGVAYSIGVRPTLYLSSNVRIISGTGKSDDPYQLSID